MPLLANIHLKYHQTYSNDDDDGDDEDVKYRPIMTS